MILLLLTMLACISNISIRKLFFKANETKEKINRKKDKALKMLI